MAYLIMRSLIKTDEKYPAPKCLLHKIVNKPPLINLEFQRARAHISGPYSQMVGDRVKNTVFLWVVDPAVRGAESHSATALPYKLFTTFSPLSCVVSLALPQRSNLSLLLTHLTYAAQVFLLRAPPIRFTFFCFCFSYEPTTIRNHR